MQIKNQTLKLGLVFTIGVLLMGEGKVEAQLQPSGSYQQSCGFCTWLYLGKNELKCQCVYNSGVTLI